MVALKGPQIEAFVARPDPKRPLVLVYGPDAGLVRERVDALINSAVDDIRDPFALARLDGDELAGEPMRLVEEASTVPLFGGRRAVWVKAGARNIAPAVEPLLALRDNDCRIVIEAGDLKKSSPLRSLCERAPNAAALPCYADSERDLARLIDEEMREANLTIAAEARAALVALIGGDRQASRGEIRKLALYARGRQRVELADVAAVVADASELALDDLVDAAFAGRIAEVDAQFSKARSAGTSTSAILFAAARQVSALHKARLAVDEGQSVAAVVESMWLHFSRKALVEAALKTWSAARLERAMLGLATATLQSRQTAPLADVIAQRALIDLALSARRKES